MNFRSDTQRLQPLSLFSQSSLTDIILLLLIFFLLTSSFVTNFGIKVNVPKAETSTVSQPSQISVAVTRDGAFFVMGQATPKASLAAEIQRLAAEDPSAILVIRADKNSILDHSVAVMNIGKALNMGIVIATEQE